MSAALPPLLEPMPRPITGYAYLGCRRRPRWLLPSALLGTLMAPLATGAVCAALLSAKTSGSDLYLAAPWPDHVYPLTALALIVFLCGAGVAGVQLIRYRYAHAAITWGGTLLVVDLVKIQLGKRGRCRPDGCSEIERRNPTLRVPCSALEWRASEHGVLVRPKGLSYPLRLLAWFLIPTVDESAQARVIRLLEQESPAGRRALLERIAQG